jgi:hypothetical protein
MCPFLFICTDAPGVKDGYSIATDRSVTSITQWSRVVGLGSRLPRPGEPTTLQIDALAVAHVRLIR